MKTEIDKETLQRLEALQDVFGAGAFPTPSAMLDYMVERWHAIYVEPSPALADDWQLRDDLSLEDLEDYWTSLLAESRKHTQNGTENMWSRYGRYIRAAVKSGWVISPDVKINDKGRLEPSPGRNPEKLLAIMTKIDRHYTRILNEGNDPN